MTDIIERLWADFETAKVAADVGPMTRRNLRTAFAAGAWAVEAILAELEVLELPPDLRGPALELLREGIERFNRETLAAAGRT